MKRLLLLALPVVLAGCPTKQPAAADATAPVAIGAPAAATASGPAKVEFAEVAVIRAAATLPRYQWQLVSAADTRGQRIEALFARPDQPVTLDFNEGGLSIANTCNRMGGTFLPAGKAVTISRLVSTKMACADPKLMALDAELGKRLEGKLGLRMSKGEAPPQLELKTATGDVLVFASMERPAKPGKPSPKQANEKS
jgi:heat shock protein HslJ